MFNLNKLYRWCDDHGGGLVIAFSKEKARAKLKKKYGNKRKDFIIWLWTNDEYYDKDNQDVFDIYG